MDYRHDEWEVDVTVAGSQKGLMLPPGLSFNAHFGEGPVRQRERTVCHGPIGIGGTCWVLTRRAFFPLRPLPISFTDYAKPSHAARGGLASVFRRHDRHARATRVAVQIWGARNRMPGPSRILEFVDRRLPARGHDADRLRSIILDNFTCRWEQAYQISQAKYFG